MNRFALHGGLRIYVLAVLAAPICIFFARKRRSAAKRDHLAQVELERRATDRLQSHDDFYPRD